MQDFTFCNKTKIVFGRDTIKQIGEETKPYGKKVMLVYGMSSIKKSGVYDTVMASLAEAGLEVVEFPGVKSNPVLSHLLAGVELARAEAVECVVAVGGGSVLDEAKAIAAGALYDGNPWDFYTFAAPIEEALPVTTVLTLAATGSEMNGGTVITNEDTNEKLGFCVDPLQPKVSIMDPAATFTVTPAYTAYGAVDAISHLIEGYFTHEDPWLPIQDQYVEALVRSIIESTNKVMADPEDYQGRATLMWAATLAWNGLPVAGVGSWSTPNHVLEHPLSALYDIAHGAGLAVVIPAWMAWRTRTHAGKVARFARNVMDIDEADDKLAAAAGIDALRNWFKEIGAPVTLAEADIPASDIPEIADKAAALAVIWGNPIITRDVALEVYEGCAQ